MMKGKTFHLGVNKIAIILLIFGVIVGALFANFFKGVYLSDSTFSDSLNISKINSLDINLGNLLRYVLASNFKKFFLVIILCFTVLGIPFMALFIFYHGFCAGFIIAVSTMQYGIKGILLFLSYLFPQYIIYVPLYIFTLWKGYEICTDMYNNTHRNIKSKMGYIVKQLPVVFVLVVVLFLGCIVETYLNTYIMQKISSFL